MPTAQAWRRTAMALECLVRVLEAEVPDTAATLRLSGMELSDAIEEVSLLGCIHLLQTAALKSRAGTVNCSSQLMHPTPRLWLLIEHLTAASDVVLVHLIAYQWPHDL